MSSREGMREAAYALGLGLDVLVFAILGFFLGRYALGDELLGVVIGVIVGTLLMWYHAYSFTRSIKRRSVK